MDLMLYMINIPNKATKEQKCETFQKIERGQLNVISWYKFNHRKQFKQAIEELLTWSQIIELAFCSLKHHK